MIAKTILIQHSNTNNSNSLYFPQMDFSAIQSVIDRRTAHACTSVATDGGEKNLPVPAELTEGEPGLRFLPCPAFHVRLSAWGFRKTRQSAEKVSEFAKKKSNVH